MAYESNPAYVVNPNDGLGLGSGGGLLGILLGATLFGRGGFGAWGNNGFNPGVGTAAEMSSNNQAFEAMRDQISQLSAQLQANQSAAQSAAVQAEISRMKDLFVDLDKDNTIRDCQSTAQILASICECCCKTQSAIAETKFTVATEACATRQLVSETAAAAALANCQTQNLINTTSRDVIVNQDRIAADQAMRDYQNTTTLLNAIRDGNQATKDLIFQTNLDVKQTEIDRLNRQLSEQTIINTLAARCGCVGGCSGSSNGNGNSK